MSVKEEKPAANPTLSFEDRFDYYRMFNPAKWYTNSSVPALSDARGKIVLLRRFGAAHLPKGIDATSWPDNAAPDFTANNLAVEDWYKVTDNPTKWTYISSGLSGAFGDNNANVLHLTFASVVSQNCAYICWPKRQRTAALQDASRFPAHRWAR